MDLFRLKACQKCRGDLVLDEGDWLCLQCGKYNYTGLYNVRAGQAGGGRWAPPALPPPRTEKHFKPSLSPMPMHVVEQGKLVPSAGDAYFQAVITQAVLTPAVLTPAVLTPAVLTPAVLTNEGAGNDVTAALQS